MLTPKISIIIPTYNQSEYVIETLESVLFQTFGDFECIIVNDGSTDATERIVQDWIERDKRFKYVYQGNSGPASARNKGILLSAGRYILPLDSDDKISQNYLEETFKILETQSEVKVVYGEAYFFGPVHRRWKLDQYNFEDLLYKNMIYCTGLYRKEDWKEVGGYDESLREGMEDWEFWINILKGGGKVVKLKNIAFYYRQKDNSLNTDSMIKHNYGYKARLYIFEKHLAFYRKTNFYDMYYENYNLKRSINNPLYFLSIKDLSILLFEASKRSIFNFIQKGKTKLKRKLFFFGFQ